MLCIKLINDDCDFQAGPENPFKSRQQKAIKNTLSGNLSQMLKWILLKVLQLDLLVLSYIWVPNCYETLHFMIMKFF